MGNNNGEEYMPIKTIWRMVRKEKEDEEGDEEKSSEISCAVRKW